MTLIYSQCLHQSKLRHIRRWLKKLLTTSSLSVLETSHKKRRRNTTEPQPDQLSKFWIEQILHLTHFYKPFTQLVPITHTHGGGPQLPFHSKISRRVSQKPKTTLQTSTSPCSTRLREFWIDSFLRIDLFLNSYYYCFLISLLLTKLLDCLVVSRLLKFALSRLISPNFA